MRPLALLPLLGSLASAEPSRDPCAPWLGTARVWTRLDESGRVVPRTLRECGSLSPEALEYARRCMALFGRSLASRRHVLIGDFSEHQDFVRLHVLEWKQDDPAGSIPLLRGGLAHGSNAVIGGVPVVAEDRNDAASTPAGCMRLYGTGAPGTMVTAGSGLGAYKLDGLEYQNACTLGRGIHFHESYSVDGVPRVMSKRAEDENVTRPIGSSSLSAVEPGRNLATSITPGCVTASSEDFAFIKSAGIVPPPSRDWRRAPAAQEGVLFVSWFKPKSGVAAPVSRWSGRPRDCEQAVSVEAQGQPSPYAEALKRQSQVKSDALGELIRTLPKQRP